jgi:hypothetical protein
MIVKFTYSNFEFETFDTRNIIFALKQKIHSLYSCYVLVECLQLQELHTRLLISGFYSQRETYLIH